MSPRKPLIILLFLLSTSFLPGAAFAQTAAPQGTVPRQATAPPNAARDPKIESWKPSLLPADALAYGAALEQNAPPKVKKWSENYATKKMPHQPISPKTIMAEVDQEFAKDSDEARDAVGFLLYYLGFQFEDDDQRQLAARIRRMDEEAYDITRQMQILKENEQNMLASTRRTPSPQQMVKNDDDMQKLDMKLRSMSEDRRAKMAQLETLRKRVDLYLKVMSVIHPRMNGIEPTILRTMK
jgi:hypothetical protein